jgi:hypothetical protein
MRINLARLKPERITQTVKGDLPPELKARVSLPVALPGLERLETLTVIQGLSAKPTVGSQISNTSHNLQAPPPKDLMGKSVVAICYKSCGPYAALNPVMISR